MVLKQKLSFFSNSFHGGGAERVMVTMASGLASRGYKIDFLVKNNYGPYKKELHDEINLIDLNNPNFISSIAQLIRYLKKNKPFLLYSTLVNLNNIAVISSKIASPQTKVVLREANIIKEKKNRSLPEKIIFAISKFVYPFAFAHVGVCNDVSNDLRSVYGHKNVFTINNPSFSNDILEKAKEDIHHPFWETKLPIVVSAGVTSAQKDFGTLIRAFHLVQKSIDSRLIILGRNEGIDSELSDLKLLVDKLGIKNKVDFVGFVNNPFSYFFRADVFVLSSIFEGFPNVLVQAMSCGLQVISTNCPGGSREILSDGKYGYLTEVGDYEQISKRIEDLIIRKPFKKEKVLNRAKSFDRETAIDLFINSLLKD